MADSINNQPNRPNSEQEPKSPPAQIPELTGLDMLSMKVVELENSISQYKDQLLRKAAEFENYKRRTESDYASIIRYSSEELITKLLPVVDDFERSLKAIQQSKPGTDDVFAKALGLIYNKLIKILDAQGVKHFDVVGTPFDPQLHDALLQVPRNDVPPHTVVEEVEKGYRLHDKVIRHARVVVSTDANASEHDTVSSSTNNEMK
jgi:molecular chaperone GrpE